MPGGCILSATRGFSKASQKGTKLEVAHNTAGWLPNFYHLGGPNALQRIKKLEDGHKWAG